MKTPSSADSLSTQDTAAPVELTDAQLDQVTGVGRDPDRLNHHSAHDDRRSTVGPQGRS